MIKAKVKEDFTMGGVNYTAGVVDLFTDDQVKRLPHLLEPVTESVVEKPPVDKSVKTDKIKKKSQNLGGL